MIVMSEDDKEFLGAVLSLLFIIVAIIIVIQCAPRNTQKLYIEECKVNYIKYPLKECEYKEAE